VIDLKKYEFGTSLSDFIKKELAALKQENG